ncbi:MAG: vitamin K epoxide reductase family protein [Thermoplasmata archaeon]
MRERTLRSFLYFVAGIGLIVSLFAAAEILDSALGAVCTVNSFVSCGKVASSGLTTTLEVPDYLWGIGGFVLILVVAALAEQRPDDRRRTYALLSVTTLGVVLAGYLLYVELAEIHALCLVCATAYVLSGFAWVGAIALARRPPDDAGEPAVESDEEP